MNIQNELNELKKLVGKNKLIERDKDRDLIELQSIDNIRVLNERITIILEQRYEEERKKVLKEIGDSMEKKWNEKVIENQNLIRNSIDNVMEEMKKIKQKNLKNEIEQVKKIQYCLILKLINFS